MATEPGLKRALDEAFNQASAGGSSADIQALVALVLILLQDAALNMNEHRRKVVEEQIHDRLNGPLGRGPGAALLRGALAQVAAARDREKGRPAQ